MEVISSGEGRELTLTLRGELDHHGAKEVMQRLEWELDSTLPVKLTLDFSGVSFMDSSGIGVIMGRYKTVTALGGKVIIYGASDAVNRLIEMSGIKSIVTVADNLENGIKEAGIDVQ